jgi:hypothetical protein
MVEIWKNIINYEGLYQVSNMGRVKSLWKGKERILKSGKSIWGYYLVNLHKNGKIKTYSVHRLVGIAFISNPDNKPEINHIDGNKTNNRADNLEWCTHLENIEHAYIIGLHTQKGEKNGHSKLTDVQVLEIRKKYDTGKYIQQELADEYNVSIGAISAITTNKNWSHLK